MRAELTVRLATRAERCVRQRHAKVRGGVASLAPLAGWSGRLAHDRIVHARHAISGGGRLGHAAAPRARGAVDALRIGFAASTAVRGIANFDEFAAIFIPLRIVAVPFTTELVVCTWRPVVGRLAAGDRIVTRFVRIASLFAVTGYAVPAIIIDLDIITRARIPTARITRIRRATKRVAANPWIRRPTTGTSSRRAGSRAGGAGDGASAELHQRTDPYYAQPLPIAAISVVRSAIGIGDTWWWAAAEGRGGHRKSHADADDRE